METVLLLLLLLPLSGSVINAAVGRLLPRRVSEVIACAAVLGALVMAAIALVLAGKQVYDLTFFPWIKVGDFSAAMNVHYDPLAAIMVLMVTFVSSLIHVYSVAFMRDDADYVRYFCYLNLFVFAMLVITVADNLIFVYLGWEGVGFCSYALIGFWYTKEANADAGRKAFVVTRIGDVAFGVALGLFFVLFHSFSLTYIDSHAAALTHRPGHHPGPAAPLGRGGQIGPTAPDGVAAGRHGRAHPGVGPDSRRHHGHGRGLSAHAAVSGVAAGSHRLEASLPPSGPSPPFMPPWRPWPKPISSGSWPIPPSARWVI